MDGGRSEYASGSEGKAPERTGSSSPDHPPSSLKFDTNDTRDITPKAATK